MAISLFLAFFFGHFCNHSNGKSYINARLLHLGYSSNKTFRRNWWKQLSAFGSRGGQISPLMLIPFWVHVCNFCKSIYFCMSFISRFCPHRFICKTKNSQFLMFSLKLLCEKIPYANNESSDQSACSCRADQDCLCQYDVDHTLKL